MKRLSNPKPYISVKTGKGYKEIKVNGTVVGSKTKKILRTLEAGRLLATGELVEVKPKPKKEEVTDGE